MEITVRRANGIRLLQHSRNFRSRAFTLHMVGIEEGGRLLGGWLESTERGTYS